MADEIKASVLGPDAVRKALEEVLAAPDVQVRDGSMLHVASYMGDAEMVRKLLDRGEDPHLKNSGGVTPMSLAERNGHIEIVRIMSEWKRPC